MLIGSKMNIVITVHFRTKLNVIGESVSHNIMLYQFVVIASWELTQL